MVARLPTNTTSPAEEGLYGLSYQQLQIAMREFKQKLLNRVQIYHQ